MEHCPCKCQSFPTQQHLENWIGQDNHLVSILTKIRRDKVSFSIFQERILTLACCGPGGCNPAVQTCFLLVFGPCPCDGLRRWGGEQAGCIHQNDAVVSSSPRRCCLPPSHETPHAFSPLHNIPTKWTSQNISVLSVLGLPWLTQLTTVNYINCIQIFFFPMSLSLCIYFPKTHAFFHSLGADLPNNYNYLC